jgi:NAD+ synthase
VDALDLDALRLDAPYECGRIEEAIVREVRRRSCRGGVVAVSGGVDSALCVSLAASALGPERVLALLMPDRDSPPDAETRARAHCAALGVDIIREDITPVLEALGCYRRRDAAVRRLVPSYTADHRLKIAVSDELLDTDRVSTFSLTTESPAGGRESHRMPGDVYRQVVAATNMKQRVRKTLEYYHAEERHAVVIGTPNRLEYELGFFVRGGDGLADVKPIAHLYKTQVYALAAHVGVPTAILDAVPSTDTYSLEQTQEEFFFGLPLRLVDLLVFAANGGVTPAAAAEALGLAPVQVERVYRDIAAKRRVAAQNLAAAAVVGAPPGGDGERLQQLAAREDA